jgi:hypothetical protein
MIWWYVGREGGREGGGEGEGSRKKGWKEQQMK